MIEPVSEHLQQRPEPVASPVQAGSQEEQNQELVTRVLKLFKQYKNARHKYDREWPGNYRFVLDGKQWDQGRASWRFSGSMNILWGSIMQEVGIETDSRPKTDFLPTEGTDKKFADILKKINDRLWTKYSWYQQWSDAVLDKKIVHVAHILSEWNPDLEDGLGDIEHMVLDPMYSYWDPWAHDVNKGRMCRAFFYAEPYPTSILRRDHPDLDIKPDCRGLSSDTLYDNNQNGTITTEDMGIGRESRFDKSNDSLGGEDMTLRIRCWMRDDSVIETKELSEDGTEQFVVKKKFPKGRYVEIANQKLLVDGPIGCYKRGKLVEAYEHGRIPVCRLVNYSYPRSYTGEPEVTHAKEPQKIVNYIYSYILDKFKMNSNPKVVLGAGAGDVADEITNEPNLILEVADVNQVKFVDGGQIAGSDFNLLEKSEEFFDRIYGLGEVSRGNIPPNVSSGILFDSVVESEQTRPRLKSRNAEATLQDLGVLDLEYILQFYRQDRIFRITNEEGFPEFIQFSVNDVVDSKTGKKIGKQAITRPIGEDGTLGEANQIPIKGVPDIEISQGTQLPFAKAVKTQQARDNYVQGLITRKEALIAMDWPNAEQVANDREAEDQATAQKMAPVA